MRAAHKQQLEDLYAQIGRLTTQLTWIKKLALTLTRAERRALVEVEQKDASLTAQAHLLSLSRSSLYYRPAPPSAAELAAGLDQMTLLHIWEVISRHIFTRKILLANLG